MLETVRRLLQRDAPSFEAVVASHRIALLHDGEACFPGMLSAIARAEREVLLEMYWFDSDATGRKFAAAMIERARAGVRVCVIYDGFGSVEADDAMFDEMRVAGCEVYEYNPIAPWRRRFRLGRLGIRDHRKLLVVDGRIAFTGGVNIGNPWASPRDGGQGWRDDMIRIEGPVALRIRAVFQRTWLDLGGSELATLDGSGVAGPPDATEGRVLVLSSDYKRQQKQIRRAYLAEIRRAARYIFIANSYFVPDRIVRRSLARAVRRGVDVRVLLPAESDVKAVYYAARALYTWILKRGIKIYEWHGGTVLHSKWGVIDDHWCTVGSFNLDYRSWRSNLELNVAVEDRAVAQAMRRRFELDLEQAERIELRAWGYRPLLTRLLEAFFYLFRKLL